METVLSLASVQALFSTLGLGNVRLVGGCVRDGVLGLPIYDLDACTLFTPTDVMARVAKDPNFTVYPTGIDHGTLTLVHGETRQSIEVTTLRADTVTFGRHAQVRFGTSWEEDAARRDFTFNALMLDADGRIYDFFDGQSDLRKGQVRFIGPPEDRLAEDWLRSLRYFRFWARFGQVPPTAQEQAALCLASQHLTHLSAERIWSELKKIVAAPGAATALSFFETLGFSHALGLDLRGLDRRGFDVRSPDLGDSDLRDLDLRSVNFQGLDPPAAWAGLLGQDNTDFLQRMRASKAEQVRFATVQNALFSNESLFAKRVRYGDAAAQAAEILLGRSGHLSPLPKFPVRARDLLNLGYVQGPEIGHMLMTIKERWISAKGQLSAAALLADLTKSKT